MARKLTQKFFAWLQKPVGSQILSTIAQYRCLSLAMDGTPIRFREVLDEWNLGGDGKHRIYRNDKSLRK